MYAASFLMIVCAAALSAFQPSTSIFQIRLVDDHASADTVDMRLKSGGTHSVTLPVEKTPVFDQSGVASASVVKDPGTGRPQLRIALTQAGSGRLAEMTQKNIHRRIAIIIDGVLYQAPVIQSEISTDSVPVRGDFTAQQAEELARKINAAVKNSR